MPGPQDHVCLGLSSLVVVVAVFLPSPFWGCWFSGQLPPGLAVTLILSEEDALAQKPLPSTQMTGNSSELARDSTGQLQFRS